MFSRFLFGCHGAKKPYEPSRRPLCIGTRLRIPWHRTAGKATHSTQEIDSACDWNLALVLNNRPLASLFKGVFPPFNQFYYRIRIYSKLWVDVTPTWQICDARMFSCIAHVDASSTQTAGETLSSWHERPNWISFGTDETQSRFFSRGWGEGRGCWTCQPSIGYLLRWLCIFRRGQYTEWLLGRLQSLGYSPIRLALFGLQYYAYTAT